MWPRIKAVGKTVWGAVRFLLSVRSLLDLLGWKAGLMALLLAIGIGVWGVLSSLPGPVVFVLSLVAVTVILFGMAFWRVWKTAPANAPVAQAQEPQPRPIPPTEPILRFLNYATYEGWIGSISGNLLHTCMIIENAQRLTVTSANNLRANLEYSHAGGDRFVIERAIWVTDDLYSRLKSSVNIRSGDKERLVVISKSQDGKLCRVTEEGNIHPLNEGRWRVRFDIKATNCIGLKGSFTVDVHRDNNFEILPPEYQAASDPFSA